MVRAQVHPLRVSKIRSDKHCDYPKVDQNLLSTLDADRDLFDAERDLTLTKRDELLSLVQLYKALGGGWQ